MSEATSAFLIKALTGLDGAASEYGHRRFDNCANLCYYACFHAAIHALQAAGIRARGGQWGHDYVPAQLEGQLINRRHVYGSELRGTLERNLALRLRANYHEDVVSGTEAERALRRTRTFIAAIRRGAPS